MNKNIKRIVAMVLAIGTISAAAPAPAANLNLLTMKAYASDTNDESTLDSLELYDSDGNTIRLYEDNDYKDKVDEDDVQEDETYYAKTSSNKVGIDISGPKDKYVRIFKGTSDSTKGKEVGDDIEVSDDSVVTTLVIKVYGEDTDDDTIRNNEEDDDEYDLQSTYKIKVKYVKEDDKSNADYDDIYLERLSINGDMINLSDSMTKYTYNVDSDVDEVTIRATPEDDDYDVAIDGDDVDSDDSYKSTVDLDKGENNIKIDIEDDGDKRVYTLIINRGSTFSTTASNETNENTETSTNTTTIKTNQWIQANGVWQYNDAEGKTVKNSWVQNYFLKADGNMATGWINYNGSWYYLGSDGAKKTAWQLIDGIWYYLDSQGKIQTGWIKDSSGKYYYLNSYGAMAYNTTIDGYKLGANGAWTGR